MIKGFENIEFKSSVIRNIERKEVQKTDQSNQKKDEECGECGLQRCWYKELEMRCADMRGRL